MTASDAELAVLRALELPRRLHEVVDRTGIAERTCRSTLDGLRKKGLVKLEHRIWKKTSAGNKRQEELEETRRPSSVQDNRSPKSLRQRFEVFSEDEKLREKTRGFKREIANRLEDLKTTVARCASIPLARRDEEHLKGLQTRIGWLLDRLDEVRNEEELNEAKDLLTPLLDEVKRILPQVEARLQKLGLFKYLGEDEWKVEIKFTCTACGRTQVQSLFSDGVGEPTTFKCENPQCGREGEVFGWPASA